MITKPRKLVIPQVLAVVTLATGATMGVLAACEGGKSPPNPPVDAAVDATEFCSVFCIPSDAGVCPTDDAGNTLCADDLPNNECPPQCRPVG